MPALRWTLPAILLVAVAALAAPRIFEAPDDSIGTLSAKAAEQFRVGSAHLRRLEVDAAQTSLKAAIETDPAFAMAHYELGHTLIWLNERESGRSEILVADSLAHTPGATTELERLVIGHAAARMLDEKARVEDYYEQLTRNYAGHPLTLRIQAQRAAQEGDPVRARELYLAVLDADPDRVEVHNTLGYMALQEGQYEDAVASFKRYAYFARESANPHDSLGEAFMWTGRYHESIEQYGAALKIDPSFLSSVIGASDALTVTGQFQLARKFLHRFEGLFERRNQEDAREIKLLQVAYQAEEWEEVTSIVQRLRTDTEFASFEPGLRLWANTLGAIAMAELGRNEGADPLVDEAEKAFDYFLNELDDSGSALREDLQLLRASLQCRMALIQGRSAAHELASLRGLIEASTHKPHRLLPYQGVLIQSLYEAGLDADALEIAPQVLGFNPNHPRTLLVCAQAENRLRNRDAALDYLDRYLDVMRDADESHPRVRLARQLHTKLSPSS
jgi:tetratricopeptide (TPR) repeat protein